VIALAIWDRLPKVWPFQAKHRDPLEPALPFTNEQRAGLQCDALPSLWSAPVKGDPGTIVLLAAKVPPDPFVESAESVRLESIGEHPH
jgi:hypothetical protein